MKLVSSSLTSGSSQSIRVLRVFAVLLGVTTALAGFQISRLLAPGWSELRHVYVDSGAQLLALAGLFVVALRLKKFDAPTASTSPAPAVITALPPPSP